MTDEVVLQIGSTLDLQQRLCGSIGAISECRNLEFRIEVRTYAPLFPT